MDIRDLLKLINRVSFTGPGGIEKIVKILKELVEKLNTTVTEEEIGEILSSYYTKEEVQTILNGYVTDTQIKAYYTKEQVDLIISALGKNSYRVAWDGSTQPTVANIPAGVVVTYNNTDYIGTLSASANTINSIYLVGQDMYVTSKDGNIYSWVFAGTTELELKDYATKAEVTQLEQKVTDLEKETDKSTIQKTVEEGLYICNENGDVIVRLDVLDNKDGFGPNLRQKIEELAGQKEVLQDGFYICNESGAIIAKYSGGKWIFYGNKENGFYRKTGNIASGETWVLSNNSVKNAKRLVFSGTITLFDSITIGHGVTNQWNSSWAVIDETNITVYNWNGSQVSNAFAHGLTIQHNIQVEIVKGTGSKANLKIASDGELFSLEVTWNGDNGNIYVTGTSVLTNCSFSWTCEKLKDGIWLFGDSFLTVSDSTRWPYYLIQDGFLNWMQNGHSGGGVFDNVPALRNLLKIAIPRTILWLCNGNHPDPFEGETPDPAIDTIFNPQWMGAFYEVENICKQNNIELVLCTFPTSYASEPIEGHSGSFDYQEPKNAFVRQSGYRYIDFNAAVGGDGSGNWWPGMKNQNDVHPTAKGAKSLYQRAIADVPELMQ